MELTIPGEPTSKARPRVTRRGTTYTPKATVTAEQRVRDAWDAQHGDTDPEGTMAWQARLVFYRYERHARDADNMAKLVLDALNGRPWCDDAQVEVGSWTTIWVDSREEAKTVVHLTCTGTPARPPRKHPRRIRQTS